MSENDRRRHESTINAHLRCIHDRPFNGPCPDCSRRPPTMTTGIPLDNRESGRPPLDSRRDGGEG